MIDEHLFTLESLVRQKMTENNISLTEEKSIRTKEEPSSAAIIAQPDDNQNVRRDSFQFQARVSPKKLLCLKV